MTLAETLSSYDYPIAKEQIAMVPSSPRDSAKLLVYDRDAGEVQIDTFFHLHEYIPRGSLLIFNDTKVDPARLSGELPSGGKVEILCTHVDPILPIIEALAPRRLEEGQVLRFGKMHLIVRQVLDEGYRFEAKSRKDLAHIMKHFGKTPLPPYLKQSPLSEKDRREKYQAIFARRSGSIAAPTASLHFTKRLLSKLKRNGVHTTFVTLHVNLGTFAPLAEKHLDSGTLHTEWYEIPTTAERAICAALRDQRPIIAVGTTALRAVESAADMDGHLARLRGETNIFIRPGYQFKIISGLLTDFHVPRSSLLMLVSALIGREKLLALYTFALQRGFRFFSFGDGMLIR